jgi:hypothetical protein
VPVPCIAAMVPPRSDWKLGATVAAAVGANGCRPRAWIAAAAPAALAAAVGEVVTEGVRAAAAALAEGVSVTGWVPSA